MKISAQCITYDRPALMDEAIESFLRQDYKGEKEMIILNDHPDQELVFDHPEIKIINTSSRFRTIGEKRNACIAMCSGEVIFPWDDDDISLPNRISISLQHLGKNKYFKNKRAWLWQNGKINPVPKYNTYPSMGCWTREFFEEVGGYSFMQSGQDIDLDKKFQKAGGRRVFEIPNEDIFYIYKFGGTGHPHLSSYGYGKGWIEIGKRKAQDTGKINLVPRWKQNYTEIISEIIKKGRS